jgi:hypothetical protein
VERVQKQTKEILNIAEGKLLRLHPMWYAFIKYCEELDFGEIQKLQIQDGLPVHAEQVKTKVKFQ